MLRSQASAPDSNASRRRTPGAILRCHRARDAAPPGSLGSVPFDRRNGGPPGLPRHRYAKAETEVPVELDAEPSEGCPSKSKRSREPSASSSRRSGTLVLIDLRAIWCYRQPLSVDEHLQPVVVSGTRDGIGCERHIQALDVRGTQCHIGRTHVLLEITPPLGARDGHDVVAFLEQPG